MGGGYVQVDETPINYLWPGHGRDALGYLLDGGRPGGDVLFRWETSRATACLEDVVPRTFTGTVQSDGYAGYRAFVKGRSETITLAGCWAHVRRKFYETVNNAAHEWVGSCDTLHTSTGLKLSLREHRAGPCLRAAVRASHSRPIIERLEALIRLKARGRHLPQSGLAQPLIMRWANGPRWSLSERWSGGDRQ